MAVRSFYDFTAKLLSGELYQLSSLRGKAALVVNTAAL